MTRSPNRVLEVRRDRTSYTGDRWCPAGVGTSTVAAALHALDAGRCGANALVGVDVLVCRGTGESLWRADALAGPLTTTGPRPVLAVTAEAGVPRDPMRSRLRDIEPRFSGVLMLPYVGRWCEVTDPHVEAAALLAEPPERLPRPLRAYAGALRSAGPPVSTAGG